MFASKRVRFAPRYSRYDTGTKEADKKTSGKVISNFKIFVNYIAG